MIDDSGGSCANCGQSLAAAARFCSGCGQRTRYGPRSLRETVQDVLGRDYTPDGRLWLTLKALAVPGKLTAEWFAGRQQRYLGPARLFLLTLFIAIVFVQGLMRLVMPAPDAPGAAPPAESRRQLVLGTRIGTSVPVLQHHYPRARIELHAGLLTPWVQGLASAVKRTLERQSEAEFRHRMRSVVVPARFNGRVLLVPLLIALLALVHIGQRRLLAEHTVFALHLESTLVLAAIGLIVPLEMWAERPDWHGAAIVAFTAVWLTLAMKRYYAAPWRHTLLRATVLLGTAYVASEHLDALLTLWALA